MSSRDHFREKLVEAAFVEGVEMAQSQKSICERKWLRILAKGTHGLVHTFGELPFHEKLIEWIDSLRLAEEKLDRFEKRREKHFSQVRSTGRYRIRNGNLYKKKPPHPGWIMGTETLDTNPNSGRRHKQGRVVTVRAWMPPRLAEDLRPEIEFPLPVPERAVTLVEKYAALAAIHDFCWKTGKINPWTTVEIDELGMRALKKALQAEITFAILQSHIEELRKKADEEFLQEFVSEVLNDLESHHQPIRSKRRKPSTDDDNNDTEDDLRKKRKRIPNKEAVDCGRAYKSARKKDPSLSRKSFVEDYVAQIGGSVSSLERTLSANPQLWKE